MLKIKQIVIKYSPIDEYSALEKQHNHIRRTCIMDSRFNTGND